MTNTVDYKMKFDEAKMKDIIDAFVSVYGEERRTEIENRLSKTQIYVIKSNKDLERETGESKWEIKDFKFESLKQDLKKTDFLCPFSDRDIESIANCPMVSFCTPTTIKTENGIDNISTIFINLTGFPDTDQTIFHELNHALETTYKPSASQDKYEVSIGWEKAFISMKNGEPEYAPQGEIRYDNKELFNEIINDLIAEQVTRNFHEQGHYLDPKLKNSEYKDNYSLNFYRRVEFIVKDFFEAYHEDIIKSRFDKTSELFEKVGVQNFEELNDLVNKYDDSYKKIERSVLDNVKISEESKEKIAGLKGELKNKTKEETMSILERMGLNAPTEEKSSGMGM